ncbi:MAG: TetR/AcrR family transcriptional regulator [Lachnospiraceae bacterium]|nr:TetR/AcrR family transcriptional regulator [Lachnospiraceae bacterium]
MARNIERDEKEAERRRKQLLEAGFDLFSRHGIEAISLQMVADTAEVGVATLYNYYQNKLSLVIAISAEVWENVRKELLEPFGLKALEGMNAYQLIEYYCDSIISLYRNKPEVLRFSANYKTYICREGVSQEQLKVQLDVLKPIGVLFHTKYEEAKTDGSIRTDLSEWELFTTFTLTMLGMAERYAQGVVWADNPAGNHVKELLYLKEMLLAWVKGK